MKTTHLVLACALIGFAVLAAPVGDLSPVSTAAASTCIPSDDIVRDVQCSTRCAPTSVEEVLDPRPCPL